MLFFIGIYEDGGIFFKKKRGVLSVKNRKKLKTRHYREECSLKIKEGGKNYFLFKKKFVFVFGGGGGEGEEKIETQTRNLLIFDQVVDYFSI